MNNLIEAIKQRQRQANLNDTALASLLGVDRSTWSKIKSGKRNPGIKFLRAVDQRLMHVEISDTLPIENPLKQLLEPQGRGLKRFCVELLGRIDKRLRKQWKL